MGFNLNTRNTNNLRGSKEIDSIGDDLINISSSLGSADVSRTFAFISLNDDSATGHSIHALGHDSDITVISQSAIPGGPNLIVSHSKLGGSHSNPQLEGAKVFVSKTAFYRVTHTCIHGASGAHTPSMRIKVNGSVVASSGPYRVNSLDDPESRIQNYVQQITSGSRIQAEISSGTNSFYKVGSTLMVEEIVV